MTVLDARNISIVFGGLKVGIPISNPNTADTTPPASMAKTRGTLKLMSRTPQV